MNIPLSEAGRLPAAGDNVAIASRRLEAGTCLTQGNSNFVLPHTILEGHRFAVMPIRQGESLLSWGLPFGTALREIAAGDYVCNAKILEALRQRHVSFELPSTPNFSDRLVRYQLDERTFKPGRQVAPAAARRFFEGFARGPKRGVGTRNFIVILGTTSVTASYARLLADRFKGALDNYPNIDGVVGVGHTEGAGDSKPNNLEILLRALAGFMVNPNVGAVLAVDRGTETVTNTLLQQHMAERKYPLEELTHRFFTLDGHYQSALAEGEAIVKSWLNDIDACRRTLQPLRHLRIGLQCGGSDAFSGVSGNPLVGWVSKELVRHGGSANLAETDELIGAEPYVLQNVRDLETARKFLATLDRFQERVAWHGHSAEGNPSGGNNFRGLYNIAIKSIGAARKKDPDVCLDYVIEYGERMTEPGFYFMDSPGNDLESIAGQVAAGCNMILFTTGNGSITNFPFVPTIKIMTNTGRYQMLTKEMDVNAGRYQDGTSMDDLGTETFGLMLQVASGQRSIGEKAGHSQVQLWREWRQTDGSRLQELLKRPCPTGEPIPLKPRRDGTRSSSSFPCFKMLQTNRGRVIDQVGLIIPTSLCSGQIGRMIADKLNRERAGQGVRYVALAHTEGCGASGGESEFLYLRTMAGYLSHPFVQRGLLLEHGCEKTHNDAMRNFLEEQAIDLSRFGWASVQLDGGIESVTAKVTKWFQSNQQPQLASVEAGLEALQLGLLTVGLVPNGVAESCGEMVRAIVTEGGTVVIPQNSCLLRASAFVDAVVGASSLEATLGYGERFGKPGFHIMEAPTGHHVETLTGLGATGMQIMLAHTFDRFLQGHPMIPVLQVSSVGAASALGGAQAIARLVPEDLDMMMNLKDKTPAVLAEEMLSLIALVAAREYSPKLVTQGNTDFQMTRGLLGVSL
ncbi:MAG: altronate dehydratase [Verrucomicrobia bacterium]|nr:altronate dehydratase [Verrucomicrobiota bacterium]